jgi:hypothetical protein
MAGGMPKCSGAKGGKLFQRSVRIVYDQFRKAASKASLRFAIFAVGLLLILAVGRLVIVCNSIIFDFVLAPHRLDLMDNLAARRMQTQVQILRRIAVVTVSIVTLSLMLMTFPEIRHIGISLLASAGLAGLIMGTAMKSAASHRCHDERHSIARSSRCS